ncbi:hypothetical protein D2E25_0631 [Bifidobacterium goeldii]|uniref:Uncharacterized protein n=1 Tax=Bifidobacterium goeldii TaxID=2306975 RepID=A0A430FNA8_9BIFI|nr:hypothetical protein [Bifidobacterium goeldii]RSX54323.1 hypothetical protein D2E25_0631 [Bifidobacterium goeldii]
MTSAPSTVNRVLSGRNGTPAPLFTWNRAHWIGIGALMMMLAVLIWGASAFIVEPEAVSDSALTDANGFVWHTSMATFWPIALAITNLILGSIRTGSLSFPVASALLGPVGFGLTNLRMRPTRQFANAYLSNGEWLELMRADGPRIVMQTFVACVLLLVCYSAIAFACYAIGRYGLRTLFVNPPPASASGRMLTWIRRDTVRFGCLLALAIMYGLLLTLTLIGGDAAFMGAIMINFALPPALLVICGAWASRDNKQPQPGVAALLKTYAFPLIAALAAVPFLMLLISPFDTECALGVTCTRLGGVFVQWYAIETIGFFALVYVIASYIGFLSVRVVRWIVRRVSSR